MWDVTIMHESLYYFKGTRTRFLGELVGKSFCDNTYYQARKNSDVTVLEYVESGEGTVKVNGINYTVRAGDVYLLPLYTNHIYYSGSKEPWVKYFINIRGELPVKLIESYNLQNQYVFRHINAQDLFTEIFETAAAPIDELYRQELFASLFLRVLIRLKQHIDVSEPYSEAGVIKSIIDNSIGKIYSIKELSEMVNRSKDYIIKNFTAAYGVTPHNYIINKKIDTAKIFLTNTELSIMEISISLGYNNVEYFSTQFKKLCGISPQQYRKQKANSTAQG